MTERTEDKPSVKFWRDELAQLDTGQVIDGVVMSDDLTLGDGLVSVAGEGRTETNGGREGGIEGGIEGVRTHVSPNHTANGKFAPGNKAGHGRKDSKREMFSRVAASALTPAEYRFWILKALHMAADAGSARGIVTVLDHIRDTAIGKPQVQRGESTGGFSVIINALMADMRAGAGGQGQDDGDGIVSE